MLPPEEAKEYCKQFEGVDIHGKRIRIAFYYKGVRCLETMRGVSITKTNIKFTSNKRVAILHEIQTGQFNYLDHFPDSKRATLFSGKKRVPTVEEAANEWLLLSERKDRVKTYRNHKYRVDKYIIPKFGKKRLEDVSQSEIKKWIGLELSELANKTINEILTPMRGVYTNAMADRLIEFNPFDHIKNLKREMKDNADPFTLEEIARMRQMDTYRESERNAIIFACFTGLRISEYLSLAWEDVDLVKREIRVRRSIVQGNYAFTKTDGSHRTISLLDQAYDALVAQRAFSERLNTVQYDVIKQDNRSTEVQSLRIVFINSNTQRAWPDAESFGKNFFTPFLQLCKIRHRGPNQCRHTFASQLLMKGVAERWIAKQLGHKSIVMMEKHYAKWMDEEMPNMASDVSKLLKMDPIVIQKNKALS